MTFTIEPMITLGTHQCDMWDDGWTVVTKDRTLDRPVRAHPGGHRGRARDPDPAVTEIDVPKVEEAAEIPAAPGTTTPTCRAAGCGPAVFGAMDGLVTNIALIAGVGGGGVSADNICSAAAPAWSPARSRWRWGSTPASARSTSRSRPRSPRNAGSWSSIRKPRRGSWPRPGCARGLPRIWPRARGGACEATRRRSCGPTSGRSWASTRDRPSPWIAAISSFVCFSIGAIMPLLPYLLGSPRSGWRSVFGAASGSSRSARRRPLHRALVAQRLRQLLLGVARCGRRPT